MKKIIAVLYIIFLTYPYPVCADETIEVLNVNITPINAGQLVALRCNNSGPVHINIKVNWPEDRIRVEKNGFERLVFWDAKNEYLFSRKSFTYKNGYYFIDDYFIASYGGMHQGIVSNYFEQFKINKKYKEKKAAIKC